MARLFLIQKYIHTRCAVYIYTIKIVSCCVFVDTAMFVYLGTSLGCHMQVIADAAAIDAKAAAGESITPLCGLPLVCCTSVWQLCVQACL